MTMLQTILVTCLVVVAILALAMMTALAVMLWLDVLRRIDTFTSQRKNAWRDMLRAVAGKPFGGGGGGGVGEVGPQSASKPSPSIAETYRQLLTADRQKEAQQKEALKKEFLRYLHDRDR